MPDEGRGYQYVHLGVAVDGGSTCTLVRDLTGGKIGLVDGDVRSLLSGPAPEYLAAQHISKDPRSVSRYLLSLVGLDERDVRKNQHNETRPLQWRDVMRLAAVDEETILSKNSPIEFGQYSDRPVESAIFRLFIEGRDDSGLTPIPKVDELKRISASKLEVLDKVIADLEEELKDAPEVEQLRDQLERLNTSLRASSKVLDDVNSARDEVVLLRSANVDKIAALHGRQDELASLGSRFELLRAQYDSDIGRLEMLAQATEILAPSDDGRCPFCGADPVHQHWPDADPGLAEAPAFAAAIASETAKVLTLRAKLDETISAVHAERRDIQAQVGVLAVENERLASEVRRLDAEVRVPGGNLTPLLDERSQIERVLDADGRLQDLRALRTATAQVDKPKTSTEVPIAPGDLSRFDAVAQEILRLWSFPADTAVHYSTSDRDLVVDQRVRRVRGKGVRSILHALFNVALAEYCAREARWHPGFVILDSPIVTYRQAGEPALNGEDETIELNVVDAFYAYLQNDFHGQSLILENKSPVSPLPSGSHEYFFGGEAGGAERAGFYPLDRE
ncbi:hypothetical protein [Demequina maris]|uniref:hypothetical protein n=1 Tax=Demequina maris TaxID=1638982 RepID=UPI0034E27254